MTEEHGVWADMLSTGVPGLDQALGGGFPRWSLNLLAGAPGVGKTTLAQQITFANASTDRPAVYFTVLGEPPLKMLRFQQRYSFFDTARVDGAIHFVNLDQEIAEGNLGKVLQSIRRWVEEIQPGIVVVDSFRAVAREAMTAWSDRIGFQRFVEDLGIYLSAWQATSFLVGEYAPRDMEESPVFTLADGILWLYQSVERNSMVRKLQVMKMRGQAPVPGLHTFRITQKGIEVFPRLPMRVPTVERMGQRRRVSTGVPSLDEMMEGGIPEGDAVLLAGTSGTGKTMLASQFIAAGMRQDEAVVAAIFEEHAQEYLVRAEALGIDLARMIEQAKLKMIYLRSVDLSVGEALEEIRRAVDQIGAKRVVIDSISGFELALAANFRDDFRDSLYRLVSTLKEMCVTLLMTVETVEAYAELRFTPHVVSFLADDIIVMRYVELESQLKKVLTVAKMRSSAHSHDLRLFDITPTGMQVGEPLLGYQDILGGMPHRAPAAEILAYPGLTDRELMALRALIHLGEGSVDAIAEVTGLQSRYARRSLERAVELGYAGKVLENGNTIYRSMVRPASQ